jgi:2'-5' RNA ligase
MTSYVIVALPAPDESVWRLSSEKKPHMTMLFLGDNLENIPQVKEYIEHLANTSLPKFGMSVDRRGVLGSESADVLFFGEYNQDRLNDARSQLLQQTDIYKAHCSVEQYPEWIPHLTMGYPKTPAIVDDREHPGISWVTFDRLALWTANYEGVEFQLKDDHALSMSEKGAEFFKHYGVKGMRWGVVRDHVNAVKNSVPGKAVKAAYSPSQGRRRSHSQQS